MTRFSRPPPEACYPVGLYSRSALLRSDDHFRRMRGIGPIVWLPRHRMWAVARFDEVRAALRARDALISGAGIAANRIANRLDAPTTLTSDGADHSRRKTVLLAPLLPRALDEIRARIEDQARDVLARARGTGWIEGMTIASRVPTSVVAELVGLDDRGREKMLLWASKTFDMLGALNLRAMLALPTLLDLTRYSDQLDRSRVAPGGWAARLFDAADDRRITSNEAAALIIDYVAPSLDTTILATGHMLWLLGTTSGALERIRAEPELIPGVVNEVVRLASPIRGFTRLAVEDYIVGEHVVRAGQRLLVLFASANRDERQYEAPDEFRISRAPKDHVGWGFGVHTCAGINLAKLELETILRTLVSECSTILARKPVPIVNNVLQGFRSVEIRID